MEPDGPRSTTTTHYQLKLAGILTVALLGAIAAHWSYDNGFQQTGIYFVAIPALMAIALTLIPTRAESNTGIGVWRGTSIALLGSALLVREGIICVIVVSPLIFLVISVVRHWNRRKNERFVAWIFPMLLFGASVDGVAYDLPTAISVTETRTIETSTESFVSSLGARAELPEIEPLLFALPFPEPTAFVGEGLALGATRSVEFGDAGAIELTITNIDANEITWTFTKDTTPLAEWMTINEATATWTETENGLEIDLTIDFDRALSPAFYFDPLQRWGVGEMAEVLLDMMEHNATIQPNAHGAVDAA